MPSISAAVSTVALASSARVASRPTLVLVHGLDSSRETWTGTLGAILARGYPAISLDLRGHGESALGGADEFCAEALARDVIEATRAHGIRRAVLIGHSMGGRVAMRAAAIDARRAAASPEQGSLFAAVVVEDMDLRVRPAAPALSDELERAVVRFAAPDGRRFPTFEACRAALLPFYDEDAARVDSWRGTRVRRRADGSWWSDINPAAARLARDTVLAVEDGAHAWDLLAELSSSRGAGLPFAVHLWYADRPGSVCAEDGPGGVRDMARRLPVCKVRHFPGAGHSIHNTAAEAFVDAACAVLDEAAAGSGNSPAGGTATANEQCHSV